MQIAIDQTAGFCTGVERSIRIAEKELEKHEQIYCLGQIIHNEQELDRLRRKGLVTIDYPAFRTLKNARVLIRAHGEPPETFRIAQENDLVLINTTCRVVSHLQRKIRDDFAQAGGSGAQVVILGKKEHPEVRGLNGQIDDRGIIIREEADLQRIDFRRLVLVYVQTTHSLHHFHTIREKMLDLSSQLPENERGEIRFFNSICKQVIQREKALRSFSKTNDVILFVSDPKSSNGNYLFTICRQSNPNSHFITHPGNLQPEWFSGARSAGITGATSTPLWLMEQVAKKAWEIVSSWQD